MKKVFTIILAAFLAVSGFALEINVKATPGAFFPFLSSGEQKYAAAGGGAFIDTGITLFNYLNVGPEFGIQILPKDSKDELKDDEDPLAKVLAEVEESIEAEEHGAVIFRVKSTDICPVSFFRAV